MQDRLKYRIWNKSTNSYTTGGCLKFGQMCFVSVETDEEEIETNIKPAEDQDNYIIEQCTGLKDTNEKLIYENDIVEQSPSGNKYKIIWVDSDCGWGLENTQTRYIRTMDCFDGDELEIVGNIHQPREEKQ